MKHFFVIFLILSSLVSALADNTFDRQNSAMLYHYNSQKYPTGEPRGNVVRAYCIFALAARGSENITQTDINEANELLEPLFTAWPAADEGNDLYWMLPHLSRILADDTLSMYLTAAAKESIKNILYTFVYDKDDVGYASTDAANMWLVIDSENHDILKKQVYFTASQIFKNNPQWSSLTYADGKTVAEHYTAWENYFESYFRERARKGINIELGSPTYAGVFLESIFIIYDLAENDTLKKRAGQFLNLYFADQAITGINGIRGGAKSRCYKGAPSYNYSSDKGAYYSWMLAGKPSAFNNGNTPYDIVPSLNSDFRLQDQTLSLYDHTLRGSYEYITVRPGRGTHVSEPSLMYTLEFPSMIRWYSWCEPQFILGSVTIDESKAYTLISDQNRWYGLIAADSFDSRLYFAPETDDENQTYKDYIAVQKKGAMLIRKHKDAEDVGFRMYVSNTFTTSQESGWLFGYNSDSSVYFALYSTGSDFWGQRYVITTATGTYGKWITFTQSDSIVVLEAAAAENFSDFDEFKSQIKLNSKGFNGTRYDYSSLAGDALSIFTDTTLPAIDNQAVVLDPDFTYSSPFLNSDNDSDVITVNSVDGSELILDFTEPFIQDFLAGDINQDGYVDILDIVFLASQWQQCTNPALGTCIDYRP